MGFGGLTKFRSGQLKIDSYLSLKEVVLPIRVVNYCAEKSLGLVTDYYVDSITRSEEQKFHLYQMVIELRLRMKKIDENKGLSRK